MQDHMTLLKPGTPEKGMNSSEDLKAFDALLGKDGELHCLEGVAKIFSLMMSCHKLESRCTYLNILLKTKSDDVLKRFIKLGGYRLLNSWITSKMVSNHSFLKLILLMLQKLPMTVDQLKQNNTEKLVIQLSKCGETQELRKLAREITEGWRTVICCHRKASRKGLEVRSPAPLKKTVPAPQLGDKYNIKPAVLKRPSTNPSDPVPAPPEKKYKPLIPVNLFLPQSMEATGFSEALNSAPLPGVEIHKSKAASPTSNKRCLQNKASSPETSSQPPPFEDQDLEQPGTELKDTGGPTGDPGSEEEYPSKKQKEKKCFRWIDEKNKMKPVFLFYNPEKT